MRQFTGIQIQLLAILPSSSKHNQPCALVVSTSSYSFTTDGHNLLQLDPLLSHPFHCILEKLSEGVICTCLCFTLLKNVMELPNSTQTPTKNARRYVTELGITKKAINPSFDYGSVLGFRV
jgi:hypothetical protein